MSRSFALSSVLALLGYLRKYFSYFAELLLFKQDGMEEILIMILKVLISNFFSHTYTLK